jgi:DNA polymerase I
VPAVSQPPLFHVDGHNLLHRAAFGFPAGVISRSGRDITMVFGFFALLRAGLRSVDVHPEVVVVFDGQYGAEDRRVLMPGYKPPVSGDETVFGDLPYIYDGLAKLDIQCVEHERWEADDVIASYVSAHPARDHLIMSTDKDFYQLLSATVSALNTQRRADCRRIGPDDVHQRHGVAPHQWCDFRALTGDTNGKLS